jgi:acyl-coenzyme A thioesterase PaaI-like protein
MKSLQEQYAPNNKCFGCGPANPQGLQIKSYLRGDELWAEWTPQSHHLAFGQVVNGGICGALLDCHSNWCAAYHLMKQANTTHIPCTVTAEYRVKLLRPTPLNCTLTLHATISEILPDRAVVNASIEAHGKITATCMGTFVSVQEGHPAYHRW